jgi:WD40 repeat protein
VLWDLAAGKEKYRWTSSAASIEPGHSVGWSSNSGLLALPDMNADLKPFDSDHGIAVIDVATGQRTALFPARWDAERAVQISPDGKLLATTGSGEGVRLFDLAAQTNIFSDPVGNPMLAASFSPDGRYLVAGSGMGGALLIYEITYEGSKINVNKKGTSAQNIGAELHQVDFAPDGNRALASSRGGVALWDATNWTTFKNLPGCEGRLSRDGTRVALVREESSDIVELWDLDVLAKTMAFPAVHETAPSPAPPNEVTRRSGNMNECISNLRRIDAAKQIWALEKGKHNADTPTMDDLRPYLAGAVLVCPDGGVYTIGTVGEKPTCSIPGHVLH